MKEATGELSMTVITIIAIVAIAGIITLLMPSIKNYINNTWEGISHNCPEGSTYVNGACKPNS